MAIPIKINSHALDYDAAWTWYSQDSLGSMRPMSVRVRADELSTSHIGKHQLYWFAHGIIVALTDTIPIFVKANRRLL
jgi:hypothetical protein